MTIDKKTIRKVFVVVVGAIFFYWLLHETDRFKMLWGSVSGVVAPFAIGSVLAFIANVPMRAIENRLGFIKGKDLRRTVAILLTFVAIILVVYGVIRLLLPQISETIMLLIPKITDFAIRAEEWILGFAEENPQVLDYIYSITGGTTIDCMPLEHYCGNCQSDPAGSNGAEEQPVCHCIRCGFRLWQHRTDPDEYCDWFGILCLLPGAKGYPGFSGQKDSLFFAAGTNHRRNEKLLERPLVSRH